MRTNTEKKEGPHLADAAARDASESPRPKRSQIAQTRLRKYSEAQRLNLKRAYYAFLKAKAHGDSAHATLPSSSETWCMRPYAASV